MIENKVLRSLFGMIKFLLRAFLSMMALLSIHYLLFIVSIILTLMLYFIPNLLKKRILAAGTEISKANKNYLNQINSMLQGIDILKEFSAFNFYKDKFSNELLHLKSSRVLLCKETSKNNFIIFVLNVMSQLIVIFTTGMLILMNLISVGALLSTTELAMKIFDSISVINQYIAVINSSIHLVGKIEKFEEKEKYAEDKKSPVFKFQIKVDKLTFGYTKDSILISNFNAVFEKGKFYVLQGNSGSGKSTFLKLLLQQLTPTDGNILIDGKNIRQYDMDNIFSYLHQQGYLFSGTIKDNILLGREETENFEIIVTKLNILLDKNVDDLSGGERQKIALARLLVNPHPVILLDESFSSIDLKSTQNILRDLFYENDFTIILITHRMQELDGIEYTLIDLGENSEIGVYG